MIIKFLFAKRNYPQNGGASHQNGGPPCFINASRYNSPGDNNFNINFNTKARNVNGADSDHSDVEEVNLEWNNFPHGFPFGPRNPHSNGQDSIVIRKKGRKATNTDDNENDGAKGGKSKKSKDDNGEIRSKK